MDLYLSYLLLSCLSFLLGESRLPEELPRAVYQVAAVVAVNETLDVGLIRKHIKTWAGDVSRDVRRGDQSVFMSYALTPRQLKLQYLSATLDNMSPEEKPSTRRSKRNILGTVLSAVTGLATSEQMERVVTLERDMRDKVFETLHQVNTFEVDVMSGISNMSSEVEQMSVVVASMHGDLASLIRLSSRTALHTYLVDGDLMLLEELILSILESQATPTHGLKLAVRCGMSADTHFKIHGWEYTKGSGMLVVNFKAMLYQRSEVLEVKEVAGHLLVRTENRAYLVHSGTDLWNLRLSELEVRLTGVECPDCALIVHFHESEYLVVKNGSLACFINGVLSEMSVESGLVSLPVPVNCSSTAIAVGASRLKLREMKISDNVAEPDDYQEVSSMLEEGHATLSRSMANGHKKLQRKLKFDQDSEHYRLASFLEVTDKDFLDISNEGMVSFSWLTGLTVVFLLVMMYVVYCIIHYRRSAAPDTPAATPARPTVPTVSRSNDEVYSNI